MVFCLFYFFFTKQFSKLIGSSLPYCSSFIFGKFQHIIRLPQKLLEQCQIEGTLSWHSPVL